jgi:predicted GIY-YIG superfamily endonuclease
MITKTRLKKHLEGFPEEFTIEELIERLLFIEKIEKRIQQSDNNETISEEELETEMKKWFK